MLDSAELEGDAAEKFKTALLNSQEWQHQLCDSGPVQKPEIVIQTLYALWKADPALASNPIDQEMATACALEAPRKGHTPEQSIERYTYFRDKWQAGLLNTMYADLSVFQRRYLASGVQHGHLNSIESMQYQNEEVCLPAEKYTGACWYAAYQLHNPFGDSIHGPLYYRPFSQSWGNAAEMIRNVGGVCGSLSNFGAAAAIANGVPAATMGEPGHCAYTVMINQNKWQPAYSLSWKRGLHTSYHGSTWGWHMLNVKSQESWDKAKQSGNLRRLAQHQLNAKQAENARITIRKARLELPSDWQNWQLSVDILIASEAIDSHWETLHQDALKVLSPLSGEISYHLISKSIYPKVLPKDKESAKQRYKILKSFQQSITDWGVGRWDYQATLRDQIKRLNGNADQQDKFMLDTFATHAEKNIFTPAILETQLANIGKDETRKQRFIATLAKSLSNSKGGDFSKVINTMAAKVLPDAAKRGDKSSFQFIGKLTAQSYPATTFKTEPFPGILLSSGGTFGIQKPGNRYDNPARHWGVIEPHGGDFHTATKPATATIQLGNFGKLSGVNIVTRNGNFHRMKNAILQTSEDGKTWSDAHTFTKAKRSYHIDLSSKNINAGYVRVIQNNDSSIHFHLFHVYGKKQN